jgi:N-acetylneuraminate lyase
MKFPDFRGFVSPIFTPFKNDGSLNLDLLDGYGKYLKQKSVPAILVNGSTGEGTNLTIEERKTLAETWQIVCAKYDILMMVMVSGCNFEGVQELAKHAEFIGADAVLVLPELYYKPKTVDSLVEYLKDVSTFCPNTPVYYYHYPARTGVTRKKHKCYTLLQT